MHERLTNTFLYEHCDVPEGVSLAEWRTARQPSSRRRTLSGSAMFSALSAFTPQSLRSRGGRTR